MKDKKIILFFRFIEELKRGVCLKDFANRYEINVRTAQRYKEDVEEIFDIKLKMLKKGCYIAPDFKDLNKVLIDKGSIEDLDKFAYLLMIIDKNLIKFLGVNEKIINRYLKEENFFIVKNLPFEELRSLEIFNEIKKAIKYRQYLKISYNALNEEILDDIKPIKIVFAEGNWYLASISNDKINNGFKFLRISYIKTIERKKKEFKRDKEAEEFLKNFQSIWSLYKVKPFEVIVKVNKEVARFFKVKKFLDSQTIIGEENGDLIIKYYITNSIEIINLAKKWIPHMKIIEPIEVKEKFMSLVKKVLL